MKRIITVPAFNDNYIWLIVDAAQRYALVVDPGDAAAVAAALLQHQLELSGILITHHHLDHTGGISQLLQLKSVPVYGPLQEQIPQITHTLQEGDSLQPLHFESFKVMTVPGHTLGHIAYFSNLDTVPRVFCGDTLFAGGCGRLFEGTAVQMYTSLSKLASLPNNTLVYCAHEYTEANLNFAMAVEPSNVALQQRQIKVQQQRQQNLPTVPSTLKEEKMTNPFLRCHHPSIHQAAEQHCGHALTTAIEVFAVVRAWKDQFRG